MILLLMGIACLLAALLFETKLENLLCGFTGVFLVVGVLTIRKYLYWSSPENRERYQEILENEKIEMHDELKEKIRDKSGRYAYIFGLYIGGISIIVFEILRQLEIMDSRMIVLYLGGYLVVQLIAEKIIFHHFMKKY